MVHNGRTVLLWLAMMFVSVPALGAELFPTAVRREAFLRALREHDGNYDPAEQMLRAPFSSPGYHTTLTSGTVHRTRESLEYAVALLDSGEPERRERAVAILRRVIALQDQDPQSKTYGIWSWFLEEPLDKMSPPDWNWADFCGTQLLQVAIDHMDRLPDDLQRKVNDSILHAARSIQRRNVGPGYTNIALMGTYVTLVAGEQFDVPELLDYGRQRLRRFSDHTRKTGSFTEYNSPTYTLVAIEEISRMMQHVRDGESKALLTDLNAFAWNHVARRFHPPTKQWAGPHSRCYATLLRSSTLAFIQRGTQGKIKLVPETQAWESIDAQRMDLQCPDKLRSLFTKLSAPRSEIEVFAAGSADEHDVIGATYLHPDFALGSVNIGDLWNQRRPLVAYWRTPSGPAALRLRCLHDNYDYAGASLVTVQDQTDILGAVLFATDRGDTHISLDKIRNATIHAKDLRVRLGFEGALAGLDLPIITASAQVEISSAVRFASGGIAGTLCIHSAEFDGQHVRLETGRDEGAAWIDLVLYSGPGREFNFAKMKEAAVVLTLSMYCESSAWPPTGGTAGSSKDKEESGSTSDAWAASSRFRLDPSLYRSAASMLLAAGISSPRETWHWQRGNLPAFSLTIPTKPLSTRDQKAACAAKLGNANPWKK